MSDQMVLVLRVPLALLDREGVAVDVEDLQVLEPRLFVSPPAEIRDDLLETLDQVIAHREYVQFRAVMQPVQDRDFVVVQGQVGQVDQLLQPLDLLDVVEGEVQPFQIPQMADVLNLFYDIVVQL